MGDCGLSQIGMYLPQSQHKDSHAVECKHRQKCESYSPRLDFDSNINVRHP